MDAAGLPPNRHCSSTAVEGGWGELARRGLADTPGPRQGTKGPLAFDFAAVPIWQKRHDKPGPPGWLVIRRSLDPTPEIKYYISNAPQEDCKVIGP